MLKFHLYHFSQVPETFIKGSHLVVRLICMIQKSIDFSDFINELCLFVSDIANLTFVVSDLENWKYLQAVLANKHFGIFFYAKRLRA
jgi:hypothetical protein